LIYAQTAVTHKEYFDYVFSYFLPFCVKDYVTQSKIVRDNRTKKIYSAISFTTMQLPCFNEFHELFYKLNVKTIPGNIYELLTPLACAGLRQQKKKTKKNFFFKPAPSVTNNNKLNSELNYN